MIARIKKDDIVVVLSGKDKNKQGVVVEFLPKKNKVIVKGCAIITKHVKARKQGEISSVKKIEGYIVSSKVAPFCVGCKKASRVSVKILSDGKKARVCTRCKEVI